MFKNLAEEFKGFISRGNVIDLAVGIIMGAAFTAIVTWLVQDVIMPPIGWAMGGLDFSNFFVSLKGGDFANLKAAQDAGAPTINYGLATLTDKEGNMTTNRVINGNLLVHGKWRNHFHFKGRLYLGCQF